MSEPIVAHLVCLHCAAPLQPEDNRCAQCGADLTTDVEASASRDKDTDGSLASVLHNRWAILGLLFLVLAGFGLPLLWKSRVFSPLNKVILTIVVLIYTALLVWLIVLGLQLIIEQFRILRSER